MQSKKMTKSMVSSIALSLVALALVSQLVSGASLDQSLNKEQAEEVIGASSGNRYVTVPSGFIRYLLSNYGRAETTGYKRAKSHLDSMSGFTIGKRGSGPLEFLNMEPYFGRQYSMRVAPRMSDLRWAPMDAFDASSSAEN